VVQPPGEEQGVRPLKIDLMYPTKHDKVFSKPRWFFEEKYDGWRLIARKTPEDVFLLTRKGHDVTQLFMDLTDTVIKLPCTSCVLDGELVAMDYLGNASLAVLNERARNSRNCVPGIPHPVFLMAFDLLELNGVDMRMHTLAERKDHLFELLVRQPLHSRILYVAHVRENGEYLWGRLLERHAEGMVAKRSGSSYRGGKSTKWLKIKPRYLHKNV
jgi:ATP-dependent DNA ligase